MNFTAYRLAYLPLVALLALNGIQCSGAGDDDDDTPSDDTPSGDDDTPSGDDDTASGDDDTPSGDDDTSSGDDDTSSGDDDTPSGDDDDTAPSTLDSIYMLNKTPPAKGTPVIAQGRVTGIDSYGSFWIQDPKGGPSSGIYVYDPQSLGLAAEVNLGDHVEVSGVFEVYYGLREISMKGGSVKRLIIGAGVPPAIQIKDLEDLKTASPSICDASSATAEPYVGVLIKTPTVTRESLVCGNEASNGVWQVVDIDSLYSLLIDDSIEYSIDPDHFEIYQELVLTGILTYTKYQYRLNPSGDAGFYY